MVIQLTWGSIILLIASTVTRAAAQTNLVSNPGFEQTDDKDFAADWGRGEFGKVGKTVFLDTTGAHSGKNCLRIIGTVNPQNPWTTCAAKTIAVKPETTYWFTWWFRAKQPVSSRTYLFLQTNLAQRVFPQTDKRDDFDWTFNIAPYRTAPGETWLYPVLTMQTSGDELGTSWWDDVGVWEKLPPEFEDIYKSDHPWEDVKVPTAQVFVRSSTAVVWGDRPEVRVYPQTPMPTEASQAKVLRLTAPGNGHDVFQLVVTPTQQIEPVSLSFSQPKGPGNMPVESLTYRIARCVPVKEVRDKSFPLGPTPDPLMEPTQPEPVAPGKSALLWIEWSPPVGSRSGNYTAEVSVLSGGKAIATIPLRLRRWGFDLPETPHYRSMVVVGAHDIKRFYPDESVEECYGLAWDILSSYRLSGFNVATCPVPTLKDGRLELNWSNFDRVLDAAKRYKASALTIGPMFGGGCSQGWQPYKFAGLIPLADKAFDEHYASFNRQIAERLKQAGLLDKAYVYPYDEPESDYMDKISGLCDLVHKGAPDLKCLMTTDPLTGKPLWGKVQAWIIPSSILDAKPIEQRRAAGDEIWIYNMTAAIEESLLEHRLYMWRALRIDAAGGLLWNSSWWNKINPWENPTAAPVAVGRNWESLYHYQAGQASLFYPDPAGKGPLIPSLRLTLIRQGVEDFDIMSELAASWTKSLPLLSPKANTEKVAAQARAAFIAPIMLDPTTTATSVARAEAMRLTLGNELEVAGQRPAVIAYLTHIKGKLVVTGYAETGTRVTLNGKPTPLSREGRFEMPVTEEQLAQGIEWTAAKGATLKSWKWAAFR